MNGWAQIENNVESVPVGTTFIMPNILFRFFAGVWGWGLDLRKKTGEIVVSRFHVMLKITCLGNALNV